MVYRVILLFIIHLLCLDILASDKMNACFITINSSEEKHVFKNKLSSGKNKGKFNFHELIPPSGEDHDWFKNSCSKNIRCDILVISGHFGGSFFGASGFNLSMDELEKRSCKKDCEGLLTAPKEVFLLGCNTLAGKEEDNRSASEYLGVLLDDNIEFEEASRMVEQRYGAVGTSFKSSMKRAFSGVPHIYGFHSVGPSGKNIKGLLKNYHSKVDDYYEHLNTIEVKRSLALMEDFNHWNQENTDLAESLKVTAFSQTSGAFVPCSNVAHMPTDDPLKEIISNTCLLKSGELSLDEELAHVFDLIKRDDFQLYLPAISEHLKYSTNKDEFLSLLSNATEVKEKIISMLDETKTGLGKVRVAQIALSLGVIDVEKFSSIEKGAIIDYLRPPLNVGSRDAVCSYTNAENISIEYHDLDPAIFVDPFGLMALECVDISERKILDKIVQTIKTSKDSEIVQSAMISLMGGKIKGDQDTLNFLEDKMNNSKDLNEQAFAFFVLSTNDDGKGRVNKKLNKMLRSKRKIKLLGDSELEHVIAFYTIISVEFESYDQLKKTLSNAIYDKNNESRSYVISHAASRLDIDEQIKFLKDPTTNRESRESFFRTFVDSESMFSKLEQKKMDISLLPYFLDAVKKESSLSNVLSKSDLSSKKKSEKFYQTIADAKFADVISYSFIAHLPTEDAGVGVAKLLVDFSKNPKNEVAISTYLDQRDSLSEDEKSTLRPLLKSKDNWLIASLRNLGVR